MAGRYGLEIRAATAADAAALAETMAQADQPLDPSLLAERLEALQREGVALLALEWGPPSGVIVLHWVRPLAGARRALVSLLLVAPDARRRGIGRLLLKAGSQAARVAGCEVLTLAVPPDGAELAGFCRQTGFSEAGALWSRPLRKRS